MIKATIDKSDLDRLVEKLTRAPDILKDAKRQAFETASSQMKQALDREIGGTGKVQSWQGAYVGSKGGYAAVRPKAKTYAEDRKNWKRTYAARAPKQKYAVGYVTNAINSGHKFPTPSGKRERYKPRIESGRMNVPGKQFYAAAQTDVEKIAQEAAAQIVSALVEHLEG